MLTRCSRCGLGLFQKDCFPDKAFRKREDDGAFSCNEYSEFVKVESPNQVKGLTTCQILDKITHQTKEYEVCWIEGSKMTDQKFYQKTRGIIYHEEPIFIRAFQGHPGINLEKINVVSHKQ